MSDKMQWPMPEGLKFGAWMRGWGFCPVTDPRADSVCRHQLTQDRWERTPEAVQEKLWKLMVLPVPEHDRTVVDGIGYVDDEQWYNVECGHMDMELLRTMISEFTEQIRKEINNV
jgi:hypothetical protein